MPLRLLEQVCHPDADTNADGWFCDATTALLLDGATPRAQVVVSPRANDTVWLVRRFIELWPTLGAGAADPEARAESVREVLRDEYGALCARAAVKPEEEPFACLAIASETGGGLELLNMGDLTLLVRDGDGSVRRFGESAVRGLDERAIAGLERARAAGVSPHAARMRAIAGELAANGAQRNVLPGYEVLEPSVPCLGRFQRWMLRPREARALLLMSDGFYRLVDTFARYDDASLFGAVEQRGLAALLGELRAIERADADCERRPRFKTHDDATALWLERG